MVRADGVLARKMGRDISGNIKLYLAMILIAALAVCLFTGFIANFKIFASRVDQVYDAGNIADVWVYTTGTDTTEVEEINALSAITKAEKRLVMEGFYAASPINAMITEDATINVPASVTSGEKGFMLPESFAKRHKIHVGDVFSVRFSVPESLKTQVSVLNLLDGMTLTGQDNVFREDFLEIPFTVTGLMTHPECLMNSMNDATYFWMERTALSVTIKDYLGTVFQNGYIDLIFSKMETMALRDNQIVIKAADVAKAKTQIEEYFAAQANNPLLTCLEVDQIASNAGLMSDITQSKQMTLVFPVIFFLVAVLVILTTVSQMIFKERTQIGLMKALGVSKTSIRLHYILLAVALITIGYVLGGLVGPFLIPTVMNQKYAILFALPALKFAFPIVEMLIGYLAFCLVTALVAWTVLQKELRKSPADGMRALAVKQIKQPKVHKKESRLPIPILMAFRNIRLTKTRSLMVVVGVLGCIALLICGFGIDDTLNYGIHNDLDVLYPSDLTVEYRQQSEENEIADVQGIAYYENYTLLPAGITGKTQLNSTIRTVADDSQFVNIDLRPGQIALAIKTARDLGVAQGDSVRFSVLGKDYGTKEVCLVYDSFLYHGILVRESEYPELVKYSNNAYVKIDADADVAAVKQDLLLQNKISDAVSRTELDAQIDDTMSSIHLMTMTLKIFAILLALVVLYNISLLNFKERYRDIATMKVLGLGRREIAQSVIVEIMLLTIVGVLIGSFLGLPMVKLVLSINETPLVCFLYHVNPLSYVISALLTLVAALAINGVLSFFVRKVNMAESLKSYE